MPLEAEWWSNISFPAQSASDSVNYATPRPRRVHIRVYDCPQIDVYDVQIIPVSLHVLNTGSSDMMSTYTIQAQIVLSEQNNAYD